MRTVHKFTVTQIGAFFTIESGETFKPLTMQVQGGQLQIWAEVQTSEAQIWKHPCVVVGTGHLVPDGFDWIATTRDGPFVWHLYVALK